MTKTRRPLGKKMRHMVKSLIGKHYNRNVPVYNGIYKVSQHVTKLAWGNATAPAESPFAINFQLGDLDQVATLAAFFDQYRIDKVIVTLIPRSQGITVTGNVVANNPGYFYTAIDYDDSNTLTLAAIREYGNAKCHNTIDGKNIVITIIPHIATAAFAGAFTSYANQKNMWLDCASTSVQHYGLKSVFPPGFTASCTAYDVQCQYFVSFKNVR